jgi:hypothetical protein
MRYPSLEEMQARAQELLQAPEACLPWEPIPARFSEDWQVDVTHVSEDYGEDRQPEDGNVTIAVAAYIPAMETTPEDGGAWRIDFSGCWAYRCRIVGYAGSAPLTRPAANAHGAFWEITDSHYLVESGVWSAHYAEVSQPPGFHHFVTVSGIHTVYEVLAHGWHCRPLPAEWAKTFTAPMPKWPPGEGEAG